MDTKFTSTQSHGAHERRLGLLMTIIVLGWVIVFTGMFPSLSQAEGLTKEQGDAILQELKGIRKALERLQATGLAGQSGKTKPPARVALPMGGGHVLGDPNAPVTLVEFTDYQCPYCRRFTQTTFPALKKAYIDTGKLRFISRDLPLPSHAHARLAAQAGHCAEQQGTYWDYRNMIFANAQRLSRPVLVELAQKAQMDVARFETCLMSESTQQAVNRDVAAARGIGATGTPTFVLGKIREDKLEGPLIVGAKTFGVFQAKIEQLLSSEKP